MDDVHCGQCGLGLDESPGTPGNERQPCSDCGSRVRRFALRLTGLVTCSGSADLRITRPTSIPSQLEVSASRGEVTLNPIVRRLEYLPPTDSDGSWTCLVYEGDSTEPIGLAEKKQSQDAFAAVFDLLLPDVPPSGEDPNT